MIAWLFGKRKRRRPGSRAEDLDANRYKRAGYKVRKHVITEVGEIDFLAIKGDQLIVGESKAKKRITPRDIRKVYEKARYVGGIPVLIKSPRSKISESVRKEARKLGVRIKTRKLKR